MDIVIERSDSRVRTLDVKGLQKRYDWPAYNIRLPGPSNHFIALLRFEGRITDPQHAPNAWIVPANELEAFVKTYKERSVVSRALIQARGDKYFNQWRILSRGIHKE